ASCSQIFTLAVPEQAKIAKKSLFSLHPRAPIFTITSVARTAETRSVRSRQQTGKNGNKPPEKLPRSHPINFNHMHSYAAM
ncbi:hypothetical protein KZ305_27840, partial [Escherichia coli]|uniref:hypothetical protein n=1 Tax=Escherichia coli TaxID=562 RepID=UPI001EDC872F